VYAPSVRTPIATQTNLFGRAVIWGLRRLQDLPEFKRQDKSIQFLEALVTLLKARAITSLLVDWPDKQTPSTIPIADLCQYIFLTRVCHAADSPEFRLPGKRPEEVAEEDRKPLFNLWGSSRGNRGRSPVKQVALMRVERTAEGIHHDLGHVLRKVGPTYEVADPGDKMEFGHHWTFYGVKWEEDLSLLS